MPGGESNECLPRLRGEGERMTRDQLIALIAALVYQHNSFDTLDDAFAEAEMIVDEGERRAKKR